MWQVFDWVKGIALQPLFEWCQQQQKQRKRAQNQQQRAAAVSSPKQIRKQQRTGRSPAVQQPTAQASHLTAGVSSADTAAAAGKGSFWSALRPKCSTPTTPLKQGNSRMPEEKGEKNYAARHVEGFHVLHCRAAANPNSAVTIFDQ
jgi:cobalamin biosynthesis Mg chelatase CobN